MSKRKSRRTCEICGVKEAHLESPRFFANFPLEENRCKEWVRVTGNEDLVHLPIEKLHSIKHICGEHFKTTHINKKKTRLKKRAVPCLKLTCAPLTDDQMSGFPFHLWKNQVLEPNNEASTSKDVQGAVNEKAMSPQPELKALETINVSSYENIASTSKDRQGATNEKAETPHPVQQPQETNDVNKPIDAPCSTSVQTQCRGAKRQHAFTQEEELTPRKKRLVEKLKKTKCTIKSMKKSAILIENIKSPVLKELVVNSSKNENRKPKGRRWTMKHKLSCLAILKRSPKTYRYLSAAVTLPSVKTLQNILKKVPMTPGINQSVLNHLKIIVNKKDSKDTICNLAFDEIALKSRIIFNEGNDIVEGFKDLGDSERSSELADHALVFLLQGLRQKFKQPIAFYFTKGTVSSANLAQMIKRIITEVTACGFTVLNTVCDQGPTNVGALRLLREASGPFEDGSDHYFKVNGKNVYIVYDVPHLFKSIRNNFLKAGCIEMNGAKGNWEHLVEVENHNRNFLYFSKITQAHVSPKYKAKMRVKLAAQVLSNTVSAVLKLLARAESGAKSADMLNTAQVVEKLDQLFDISNGPSGPNDIKRNKRQNVSVKTNHMEKWAEYINILNKTMFINQSGLKSKNVKCIHGFITTLKSLRDIWWTVKGLGFKYLNLRNLNQDALENLFGVIRQHSPTNRNPTASHFMAALKTAVVTGLTAPHSRGANCENDNKILLTDFHNFIFGDDANMINEDDVTLPVDTGKDDVSLHVETSKHNDTVSVGTSKMTSSNMIEEEFFVLPEEDELSHDFSLFCEQPTVYVAGFIAKQVLKKYNCEKCKHLLIVSNPKDNPIYAYILLREWWQSKFSLTYPSTSFCETIQTIVNITETELLPQLHKPNICLLGCTLYEVVCPNTCFVCDKHGTDLKASCFKITCKLLIRRQCQRINQSLASKEEDIASLNKRAEQQGKAK